MSSSQTWMVRALIHNNDKDTDLSFTYSPVTANSQK